MTTIADIIGGSKVESLNEYALLAMGICVHGGLCDPGKHITHIYL